MEAQDLVQNQHKTNENQQVQVDDAPLKPGLNSLNSLQNKTRHQKVSASHHKKARVESRIKKMLNRRLNEKKNSPKIELIEFNKFLLLQESVSNTQSILSLREL